VNYDNLAISLISSFIVIYKLGLSSIPWFISLFPHLSDFLLVAVLGSIPFNIALGMFHARRRSSGPLASEIEVSMETNPYMYKMVPGKEAAVLYPMMLLSLDINRRILKKLEISDADIEGTLGELEVRVKRILKGEEIR
jgi:hypothetical protein